MGKLVENGPKSMVIGILGAFSTSLIAFILSFPSPPGCVRRTSSHAAKVGAEPPCRDICKSCSEHSRPSGMRRPYYSRRRCVTHSAFTLTCTQLHLAESTTIALLAKHSGLLDPLREFIKTKPVWGSCAGAILMSRSVTNAKQGGQDLLGGLSVTTVRNGWGSQVWWLFRPTDTILIHYVP